LRGGGIKEYHIEGGSGNRTDEKVGVILIGLFGKAGTVVVLLKGRGWKEKAGGRFLIPFFRENLPGGGGGLWFRQSSRLVLPTIWGRETRRERGTKGTEEAGTGLPGF